MVALVGERIVGPNASNSAGDVVGAALTRKKKPRRRAENSETIITTGRQKSGRVVLKIATARGLYVRPCQDKFADAAPARDHSLTARDPAHLRMDDPSCLRSPVLVLTDSLRDQSPVSIHDLLDAYATFALRIRIHGQLLSVSDTLLPALAFLRTRKDDFVCALRRDVRLAHTDPFPALFPPDDIRFEPGIHLNISIPAMQYARDSSSLCHHALCALTTIFRFPAFFSILSGVSPLIPGQVRKLTSLRTRSFTLIWRRPRHCSCGPTTSSQPSQDVFSGVVGIDFPSSPRGYSQFPTR